MALSLEGIISDVRNLIPNLTVTVLKDSAVETHVKVGLNRLNRDAINQVWGDIAGTGNEFYSLSGAFSDWVIGQSSVLQVLSPKPVVANDDEVLMVPNSDYVIYNDGVDDFLKFLNGTEPDSSETIHVQYSVPWTLAGLSGATATTVPQRLENALIYIATAMVAYALAGQSAGTTNSSIPGDLINYRSKESEYRRTGKEWERLYEVELGIGAGSASVAAAIGRRDYNTTLQNGESRMTHADWRR